MFRQLLVGGALTAITVIVHAIGTTMWLRVCYGNFGDDIGGLAHAAVLLLLVATALYLFFLHLIESFLWAITYWAISKKTPDIQKFEDAVYLSLVTFTSLGFGDIVLKSRWRLVSGTQAVAGLIINGWTAAFMFTLVSDIWRAKLIH